jgi:hypothetical protein
MNNELEAADAELRAMVEEMLASAARPLVKILVILITAIMVIAGTCFRSRVAPTTLTVMAACTGLVFLAAVMPILSRHIPERAEPRWVRAAVIHERSLPSRVPGAIHQVANRYMIAFRAQPWRSAHMYVHGCPLPPCADPSRHGLCQAAGVLPMRGRLLVVLGEHLTSQPQAIAAALLAHEYGHVSGWRYQLFQIVAAAKILGWAILGWAVPLRALVPAILAFYLCLTLSAWLVEISCDLASAAAEGPHAMLQALEYGARTIKDARLATSPRRRFFILTLTWAAGMPPPPFGIRRAAIRWRSSFVRS